MGGKEMNLISQRHSKDPGPREKGNSTSHHFDYSRSGQGSLSGPSTYAHTPLPSLESPRRQATPEPRFSLYQAENCRRFKSLSIKRQGEQTIVRDKRKRWFLEAEEMESSKVVAWDTR